MQVSGYEDSYSVKNVFDLGGNLKDMTAEANAYFTRYYRGGYYYSRIDDNNYFARVSTKYYTAR